MQTLTEALNIGADVAKDEIVGPRYADALVLRAAHAFESAKPIRTPDLAKL